MRLNRVLWLVTILSVAAAISSFMAYRKLQLAQEQEVKINQPILKVTPGTASPSAPPSSDLSSDQSLEGGATAGQVAGPTGVQQPTGQISTHFIYRGCLESEHFGNIHRELGNLVNRNASLHQNNMTQFLKLVNDFWKKNGLPFPIEVQKETPALKDVVLNHCRSSCRGHVFQVFAFRPVYGGPSSDRPSLQVLKKDGSSESLPLYESGLGLLTIDEVSGQGVPFRSWMIPVVDSPVLLKGTTLYVPMDIPDLYLKVSEHANWQLSLKPEGAVELESSDPTKVPGCSPDENCWIAAGSRKFKSPRLCSRPH